MVYLSGAGLPRLSWKKAIKMDAVVVVISCMECTGQRNDFELIPTIRIETRHPIEGSFGNEFSSIYNHCGVMAA